MNLYLISQTINDDYDTYDAAVVCSTSETDARLICPAGSMRSWAKPQDVQVEYLGKAAANVEEGVVLASFNAG